MVQESAHLESYNSSYDRFVEMCRFMTRSICMVFFSMIEVAFEDEFFLRVVANWINYMWYKFHGLNQSMLRDMPN